MKEKVNGYYESQRRAKREYKKRNRDKINAARSARRIAKRAATLVGKKCGNCECFLEYSPKASIRFCETCRRDNPKDIRALEPKNVELGRRLRPWQKIPKEKKISYKPPRRTRKYVLQQLSLSDA